VQRFETNLRIPGPTSLPSPVREAGARQMSRISHLGDMSVDQALAAIGVLEEVSLEQWRDVVPGSGVAAAQRAALEAMANGVPTEVGA
jgi:aspartate aminotransferase-like enzyme